MSQEALSGLAIVGSWNKTMSGGERLNENQGGQKRRGLLSMVDQLRNQNGVDNSTSTGLSSNMAGDPEQTENPTNLTALPGGKPEDKPFIPEKGGIYIDQYGIRREFLGDGRGYRIVSQDVKRAAKIQAMMNPGGGGSTAQELQFVPYIEPDTRPAQAIPDHMEDDINSYPPVDTTIEAHATPAGIGSAIGQTHEFQLETAPPVAVSAPTAPATGNQLGYSPARRNILRTGLQGLASLFGIGILGAGAVAAGREADKQDYIDAPSGSAFDSETELSGITNAKVNRWGREYIDPNEGNEPTEEPAETTEPTVEPTQEHTEEPAETTEPTVEPTNRPVPTTENMSQDIVIASKSNAESINAFDSNRTPVIVDVPPADVVKEIEQGRVMWDESLRGYVKTENGSQMVWRSGPTGSGDGKWNFVVANISVNGFGDITFETSDQQLANKFTLNDDPTSKESWQKGLQFIWGNNTTFQQTEISNYPRLESMDALSIGQLPTETVSRAAGVTIELKSSYGATDAVSNKTGTGAVTDAWKSYTHAGREVVSLYVSDQGPNGKKTSDQIAAQVSFNAVSILEWMSRQSTPQEIKMMTKDYDPASRKNSDGNWEGRTQDATYQFFGESSRNALYVTELQPRLIKAK